MAPITIPDKTLTLLRVHLIVTGGIGVLYESSLIFETSTAHVSNPFLFPFLWITLSPSEPMDCASFCCTLGKAMTPRFSLSCLLR